MTITKIQSLTKEEVKEAIRVYEKAYYALIDLIPYEEENTRAIRSQLSSMIYHLGDRLGELEGEND
jgi:uncharacterized protein YqiB (DUF1249 family)